MYENDGESYLTVAFGCTGGKHRSVKVAEEMAFHLKERGCDVSVVHLEIERDDRLARANQHGEAGYHAV